MTEQETTTNPIPEKAPSKKDKNYKWEPTDNVAITGLEYDIVRKTLDVFRGAPAFAASIFVIDAIFSRMIEQGLAKEVATGPAETETKMDEYIEPESETINPS